jgi:hypothetical protein
MKLKDILIKDYLQLKDKSAYDLPAKHIPAKPEINGINVNFHNVTFDEMTVLKKNIQDYNVVLKIFTNFELENIYFFDFVQFYKWVIESVTKYSETEQSMSDGYDTKLINAGIENLNKYAELNSKIALAEQFGKLPADIGKMRYLEVLQIMGFNSERFKIQQNLNK